MNYQLWTRPVTPVVNGSYSYAVAWTSTRNETTLFQTELKKFGLLHVDGYNVTVRLHRSFNAFHEIIRAVFFHRIYSMEMKNYCFNG